MTGAMLLHARLVLTLALLLGGLTLWGLLGGLLRRPVSRYLRAGLGIAQLLIVSEAALGVALWLGGAQAARLGLHVLYAAFGCATIPAAHRYLRSRSPRTYQLGMAGACLFLLGIVLRAYATGRVR